MFIPQIKKNYSSHDKYINGAAVKIDITTQKQNGEK